MGLLDSIFGNYSQKEIKKITPLKDKVLSLADEFKAKSDQELKEMTVKLKERVEKGETLDSILPEAFANCIEASDRVLGMRHFPVQIIGGIVLHQGRIAEMKTGEGKTLVATLPAYLNALSGKGVHIVTVNDYLAKHAAEWMGKLYGFLGLKVGCIVHDMKPQERKKVYECDITYGTNSEFGFDYLRDNMATYKTNTVQRGHNFTIVDEVDSILIDEARTPLIISGRGDKSSDMYKIVDGFAKKLSKFVITELDSKEDSDQYDGDYIVDEKAKTATLTKEGIKKAESFFNIENLMDTEQIQLLHHINQAIRANGIMTNEVDYVVRDGQVIIVDEFTGRMMEVIRCGDGLHQAIEAKEGVTVAHESKTLATITYQNYFRMYSKLSGMTGTAMTEEAEFREIYGLDVVEIPTNKPIQRLDQPDAVYKTEEGKYRAIVDRVQECNKTGQPVLVGTVSIEKSEKLSKLLSKRGVKHVVLNAKYHEKEAEIVSQAGGFGSVTIATNMAGRGTDIMLGGNAEFLAKAHLKKLGYTDEQIADVITFADTEQEDILQAREIYIKKHKEYKEEILPEAEKVKKVGGLFVLGTERHESRRVDNQLRGRSGRQGDVGESQFFLSLEDDLMRLFGGDRIQGVMEMMGIDEDTPIEAKMLSNTIQNAQKKVEGRNFAIRKNVLQYDDVMNRQREIIYSQRNKVLDGEDIKDSVLTMMDETIDKNVDYYLSDNDIRDNWDVKGLKDHFFGWLVWEDDLEYADAEELAKADKKVIKETLKERGRIFYNEKEKICSSMTMRDLERMVLLKMVDMKWMDHIDNMEELKRGIHLRAYAQKDPVVEYRLEGFDMFDEMINSIREDTVKTMLTVNVQPQQEIKRQEVSGGKVFVNTDTSLKKEPVKNTKKVGRNDECPCGSGKKYKKCCGAGIEE